MHRHFLLIFSRLREISLLGVFIDWMNEKQLHHSSYMTSEGNFCLQFLEVISVVCFLKLIEIYVSPTYLVVLYPQLASHVST